MKVQSRFIVGLLGLILSACGNGPEDERTLHRGNDAEPLTLDPNKISMMREFELIYDMFVGLYEVDAAGEPVLGLADSVEVSDDGLTWTFQLRQANWSDGTPITADDAVYGIQRSIDPTTLNSLAINLFVIENAEAINQGLLPVDSVGARSLDERTLELQLVHPTPYLPFILTGYGQPMPRHVIEAHGDNWVQPENMVTSGAYRLSDWRSNQFVRLDQNPEFYDAEDVCFETVFYYPTMDRQAAERRVRTGELDLNVEVAPGGVEFLRANHPELLRETDGFRTNFLTFNTSRPPFDDIRVRTALSLAIDRRFLADDITKGVKKPNWRGIAPGIPEGGSDLYLPYRNQPMEERQAQALSLLQAAGYGEDNPLNFELRTHLGFPLGAPVVQQDWNVLAPWVNAEILQNDIQLHYAAMRSGDFDVGYSSWTPDFPDPYAWLYRFEHAAGDLNYSRWVRAEFDESLQQANATLDTDLRLELIAEAERLLLLEHPIAPLSYDTNFDLVNPAITGWQENPYGRNPSRWLCRVSE